MTWWRHEVGFSSNPAGRAAGLKGRALWTEGIDHSTDHLTDGRIDKHMLALLAAKAEIGNGRAEARKLVEVGLWVDMGDYWQIPNWHDYQPARSEVEAIKAKKAIAGAEGNHKRWHVRRGITVPDCPFCNPDAIANGSHGAKGLGSQNDRHDTTRHVSTNDQQQQPVLPTSDGSAVDQAIDLIAEYRTTIAEATGKQFDISRDAYAAGVAKAIRASTTDFHRLAEAAEREPAWTPEQLRDWYLDPEPLTSYDDLIGAPQ